MQPPGELIKRGDPRFPASATAASRAPPVRPRSSTPRPKRPPAAASRCCETGDRCASTCASAAPISCISEDELAQRRAALEKAGGFQFPASQTPWQEIQRSMVDQLSRAWCSSRRSSTSASPRRSASRATTTELLLGDIPDDVRGTIRIERDGRVAWSGELLSGEANMCHSIVNLEHHHFKYAGFRRPGDVHVYYVGASGLSCGDGFATRPGDRFVVDVPLFGRPLRNTLAAGEADEPVVVKPL
jgi:hypothetical protein